MKRNQTKSRPKTAAMRKSFRARDGLDNFKAKLGLNQDNLLADGRFGAGRKITSNPTELENMYVDNALVGQAIEIVAEDMISPGVTIQSSDMSPDDIAELQKAAEDIGVPGRLCDTLKWARLYGGAIAVLQIEGQNFSEPLDRDAIGVGDFKGLYVLDRHQVTPTTEVIEDLGPMLGYPAGYTINDGPLRGKTIHHSRAIRFIGIELPMRLRQSEMYWGASVIERAYERLLAFDSATFGASNMLFRSFLRVIGVEGLRSALSAGGDKEKGVLKMMEMFRQMQSNEGIALVDSKDTFQTFDWNFGGIYDALQAFAEQVSAAFGIPLARLLGQSPKGFSTGEADQQMYAGKIKTAMEDNLRGPYALIFDVQSRSTFGRPLPKSFNFTFNPLTEPTDLEKSQAATSDAQGVAALRAAGVLTDAQALKELKASSARTGRFASITDDDIKAAEEAETAPPPPSLEDLPTMTPENTEDPSQSQPMAA